MNKNYIIIAVIVLVAIIGFMVLRDKETTAPNGTANQAAEITNGVEITNPTDSTLGLDNGEAIEPETVPADIVIRMTANGFEPKTTAVPLGAAVAFSNETSDNRWPASAMHPTHEVYPEFDPQRGIAPGESWVFTFDKAGTWKYHDHVFPNFFGTITVE